MSKVLRNLIVVAILIISSSSSVFAISRVAARFNVMEFTIGSNQAQGTYNKIGIGVQGHVFENIFKQAFDFDADELYKNSNSIGINYGRLINDNIVFNVGFSFTDIKHKSIFQKVTGNTIYTYPYPNYFKLKLYNVDFNWNYYFMSPVKKTFAPYAGVGLQAGLLSVSVKGFSSESDFVTATAFNFGADITVWKAPNNMSLLKVSSINSYQFYASESRPKYMTIGIGLRYFMRP